MSREAKIISSLWRLLLVVIFLSTFISTSFIRSARANEWGTFEVQPAGVAARTGQTFSVDVWAYDVYKLYSWQVHISWNEAAGTQLLNITEVVFAGFLAGQPEGSTTNTRVEDNFAIVGEGTMGQYFGLSKSGLLVTLKFLVEQAADTPLTINLATTYYYYCEVVPQLNKVHPTKLDGSFAKPWAEDINADGWVDIFDISSVGISYGRYNGNPPVTRNATTTSGAWTNPTWAYTSDNQRATAPATASTYQIYGTYGFVTTGWLGLTKVEVGLEMYIGTGGNDQLSITVSGDGGGTWSSAVLVTPTTTEAMYWVDVTALRSWTLIMLSDANLRVRGTWSSVGGSGAVPIYVDWIPVRVTPSLPQCYNPYSDVNNDGAIDIGDLTLVAVKFGTQYP